MGYICREMSTTTLETSVRTESVRPVIAKVVSAPKLHCLWLNTLSYMEHVGATKIARSQSGPSASFMILKHASEEARHAFFLKKLCLRIDPESCPDYSSEFLLAPTESRQYLYRLDTAICRLAKEAGLSGRKLADLAYLLVTWAIEVRADALYPVYQEFLKDYPVKLSVLSIINEEEGHLEEMERALSEWPRPYQNLKQQALEIEQELYASWIGAVCRDLGI